ncbi:MAG TPA: M48 family metallopeptidase [Terriglobales bacterium]|nr:M48 family metallopeptidase [Terriglobales bacterium]
MRRSTILLAIPLLALAFASAQAQESPHPQSTPSLVTATTSTVGSAPARITHYSLPPDLYRKAVNLGKIRFRLALLGFPYSLVVLWLILHWKLAPKYRDWAERFSHRRFLQCVTFAPPLLLTIAVLTLPLDIYGESVEKQYGISIQPWSSWAWDWIKAELIFIIISTFLIWLLYAVIRRNPRRWWFYFWLVSLPVGLCLVFLQPWVFDPLFHKFEPLQQKDPALTAALQNLVQRAGEDIPPDRMFWMQASDKTVAINAYVAGVGASKRIVVWDTTIQKMTTPEIVYVAGHEMGHYVLFHIPKGLALFAAMMLVLFYVGYRLGGWTLARWGAGWKVRALDDWASLPVLLLLITILFFVAMPAFMAISRHFEHQADQYGLEVTRGLTPDFGEVAAQAFEVLGESALSNPEPNPVDVFLFFTHPSIPDRIQFCLTYDPWSHGGSGEFVK